MKKLMTLLGFLFFANLIFSQNIVQENKMWNVIECMNFGSCTTVSYRLSGDTTIGNLDYIKLYTAHDTLLTNWYLSGAMRETQQRVFFNDFENETLLYDFGLSVSDTFRTTNLGCPVELIVSAIDTVTIFNGEKRQRILFNNEEEWIQSIGSLYGLMQVGVYQCSSDMFYDLSCCHLDEEQIFKSTLYDQCLVNTVGIDEKKADGKFTISPNPFSESTTLRFTPSNSQNYQLQILTRTGQVVRTINNITSGEIEIGKGTLKPGLYFFRLLNHKTSIASGKLILI